MGRFNLVVDSLKRLVEFRRIYGIPDDVELSYCPKSKVDFVMVEGRVVITLVWGRGGGRIHMSKILTKFLRCFMLCPDQCTPNIFRQVSSVAELNRRFSLNLIKDDINFVYSFQDNKILGFYFKAQDKEL